MIKDKPTKDTICEIILCKPYYLLCTKSNKFENSPNNTKQKIINIIYITNCVQFGQLFDAIESICFFFFCFRLVTFLCRRSTQWFVGRKSFRGCVWVCTVPLVISIGYICIGIYKIIYKCGYYLFGVRFYSLHKGEK